MTWLEILKELGPIAYSWIKQLLADKKVLILGGGGVGKTTLGVLLQDSMSLLKQSSGYEESFDTDVYRVKGIINATVYTVAGQKHRRDATWKEVLDEVQNGTIAGVILLNAFGYHSIGALGLEGEPMYRELKASGKEGAFVDAYTKQKRNEEIEVLTYIAPYLKARKKGKLWLLSVITKEDLWYDDFDSVHQYYKSGEYEELVESIRQSLGTNAFRHELVSMSMSMSNFETGCGEKLAEFSRQYDQPKQAASGQRFFHALSALCKEAK